MYVAVKGGERAIGAAACLAGRDAAAATRRCRRSTSRRSSSSCGLAVDRVMAEGSLPRPRPGGAGASSRRAAT